MFRAIAFPLVSVALAAAALASAAGSRAGLPRSPTKPIRIIVPTSPAGGNDAMARIVAQKLHERMKQPVIVENKAGANGAIGVRVRRQGAARRLHDAVRLHRHARHQSRA